MPVDWPARTIGVDGEEREVRIVDSTAGSFGIAGSNHYAEGDCMTLSIDAIGTFVCDVLWASPDRFGARIRTDHSESAIAELAGLLDDARCD